MNELPPSTEPDVYRPSAAINPERLDYLWTLAERISSSSLVPETLKFEGSGNNKQPLPREQVVANVFAVCEQADRWNQSPFALLSCAAIVHGKLGFEGKVIAAVLEANFGIVLHQYYTGNPTSDDYRIYLCDQELPEDVVSELAPGIRLPGYNILDGSVAEWKTTGNGSPWRPNTFGKMLVYRGTREWSRVYKPAAIMGVLADDELLEIEIERRANNARNVTPSLASRFGNQSGDGFTPGAAKQLAAGGLPMERFDGETGELIEANSGAQSGAAGRTTPSRSQSSAKSAHQADGASDSQNGRSPTNSSSSTTSSQAGDDKSNGGAHSSSQRAPVGIFEAFSSALFRFGGTGNGAEKDKDKATQASDAFWADNGGKPTDPADIDLCKKIIAAHLQRMTGSKQPDAVKKDVAAIIDQSFNRL